nr:site-specific integrase [Leeuwenhoekiella aestuarii]
MKSEYKCDDIYLTQIDYTFIVKFEDYLRDCKTLKRSQPLNNNGRMKHLERLKKFTTLALKHRWIKSNPFALYQLKYEDFDCPFLEENELKTISSIVLVDESLSIVRDVFVFSCYTGLCYIEVKNLKNGDVVNGIDKEEWIMVRRQKSKTPVKLPLLEQAKQILEKYEEVSHNLKSNKLLPVFSDQKINKYLKEIAKLCKINKNLTFHVARHTFATTVTLLNDVPIETVSKMLGHTKLSTTQKYARVVEQKISRDMCNLKSKLKKTKSKSTSGEISNGNGHLRIV